MKYKLIAVDLDGTLYNDQLKITSDTLNTMIKAQEMARCLQWRKGCRYYYK